MSCIGRNVMDRVLAALPEDGTPMTRIEIHAEVDQWAPITIKHALRQLRVEGTVKREGPELKPVFRRALDVSRER